MEKRFILFLVLMFAILMANNWIMNRFFPPKKPPQQAQAAATATGTAAKPTATPTASPTASPTGTASPAVAQPAAPAAPAAFPARRVTLGSLDDASPYRMLITFNSRGGVVERVELNNPRYHEVDELHPLGGYLGSLAVEDYRDAGKPAGVKVRVVGPGTPAAGAGLQVEDVIVAINDAPTLTVDAFDAAMRATDPRDEIKVRYLRGASEGKPGETRNPRSLCAITRCS
ncbi:MAG: PDZ domain-containing protein [Pirellulales bacterium]